MKKLFMIFGILALLFAVGCGNNDSNSGSGSDNANGSDDGQDETYTITISNSVEEDTSMHQGLLKFKEVAEEKSDGRLVVEIFPNGELYTSERDAIEATQAGNIEMTLPATGPMVGFVEEFMALHFMFVFEDAEDANNALDGEIGDVLNEKLEDHGLKGLGWANTGMIQITNNSKPLETVEDFKNLKIRTMENDIHLDSLKAVGASPQPYAFGEIYSALQQNIFDGIQTPPQLMKSSKIYEVQNYLTLLDIAADTAVLIMNKDFFDSLPEDLQQIVDEAGQAFSQKEREVSKDYDADAIEFLSQELEANVMAEEVRQELAELMQPVMDNYEDKIGSELLDLLRNR